MTLMKEVLINSTVLVTVKLPMTVCTETPDIITNPTWESLKNPSTTQLQISTGALAEQSTEKRALFMRNS